jgi:hypothetical protein
MTSERSDRPNPGSRRRGWVLGWLGLMLAPLGLFCLARLLGLMLLVLYLGYYAPLWWMGEPFFRFSSDIGWWLPAVPGMLAAALIYSLVYWAAAATWLAVRRRGAN